ncbi:hypothetical protein Tco_1362366 [Tanacetum coccineum]
MWPQSDNPITLTLQNYKPPIGRPLKKRKKSAAEIYDDLVKKGRQKGSTSGSQAPPQAPSQTTTHASAQAPQSSTQPSHASAQTPQSSTQPSQSSKFTKSTANMLSPLKHKFVCPRPATTQKKVALKSTVAATKKKVVPNAKTSHLMYLVIRLMILSDN